MSLKLVRAGFVRLLLVIAALILPTAAWAKVDVTFHSFSGSFLTGRYPHAFVAFDGTLDDGEPVHTNYGYSAVSASPAVLAGPVRQAIFTEKEKYIRSTNSHFTVTVSDETYKRMIAEMVAWRDKPGKNYDLDHNNCIHFAGAIMQLAGIKVDYPPSMLRHPKEWMNHIAELNPQLHAKQVR